MTPLRIYAGIVGLLALAVLGAYVYHETVVFRFAYENSLFCGQLDCGMTFSRDLPLSLPSSAELSAIYPLSAENRDFHIALVNLLMQVDLMAFSTASFEPPPGSRVVLHIDRPGQPYRVFAVAVGGRAAVVFRGLTDLHDDMEVQQVPLSAETPDLLVHSGYQAEFTDLSRDLMGPLGKFELVVFAGHSLGGALAVLAARAAAAAGAAAIAVTYGTPRVGNAAFAAALTKVAHVRIENAADIVPTLPPAVTPNPLHPRRPFFYRHSGHAVRFESNWESITNNHCLGCYRAWLSSEAPWRDSS